MLLSLSFYGGPYLWWLLGLLTCRKAGVNSRTVYMGFMADKVALGCGILLVLRLLPDGYYCISAQSHLSVQRTDSETLSDGT
jgi:hypothetical protein